MASGTGCAFGADKKEDAYGEKNPVAVTGSQVIVELKNLQFMPKGIRIKAGTTVTWVNKDVAIHNVSQVESAFLSQDELRDGDSYSFTFSKPGIYRYQCTFHHPTMNGLVIVEE